MSIFGNLNNGLTAVSLAVLSIFSLNTLAATATYNPADNTVDLPIVEVLDVGSSSFYSAKLQLLNETELVLIEAQPISPVKGVERNVFDSATSAVHVSSVVTGADEYYARLQLVPGSNPLRFTLVQLVNNQFQGCPNFSTTGPTAGSCILSGEIKRNVTLTKNIQWILSGGVFIGGDKVDNAIITINPGTQIFGQQGADYLWIRRGSKIMAEGTPDAPIVFSGPSQQSAGEWGGLVISGQARINGCNEDVAVCEVANEAITSEFSGGDNDADNSGVLKYVQILFAGFAVRPDEELNGLTLNSVGSGTMIDYVQVHSGLDDGIEMFGGTVNMKHLVLTNIEDDSLDWGLGWRGMAQYVLVKQSQSDGDHGIEADNNPTNNNLQPRSKPILSNMTLIGTPVSQSSGALLRRGTGVNIWNSVFTQFKNCLTLDGEATAALVGTNDLTISHSFVHGCENNFSDGGGIPASTTADWFNSQEGNSTDDPLLNDYLPASGSPLLTSGTSVGNAFFTPVNFVGAFKDENSDWTEEWTFPF